jgi:hypothetical protein
LCGNAAGQKMPKFRRNLERSVNCQHPMQVGRNTGASKGGGR